MFKHIKYISSRFSEIDPAWHCEICGFCAVKSVIITSMVAVRKRDYKLASVLSYLFGNFSF